MNGAKNLTEFLKGGGETGELIRNKRWEDTPLGPPDQWPQSLKTCVRIILTSRQPMFVWWGSELINLYNDAYKAIVGGRHPWALGAPAKEVWGEIWDEIEPRINTALNTNEGTYDEALLLIMERNGYPEETYYTFSYSPVPGDTGKPEGIICANTDDTQRILGERQLRTLKDLGKSILDSSNDNEVYQQAVNVLEQNPRDFPFAAFYRLESNGTELALQTHTKSIPRFPAEVKLTESGEISDLISEILKSGTPKKINIHPELGDIPAGPWQKSPEQLLLIPINQSGQKQPFGLLKVGLNPYQLVDEKYTGFFQLVADQVATGIANVRAYEEERRRSEALAEIDRVKTAFFSNISHEFRTPLTLMLGPLEELLNKGNGSLTQEHRESIESTHRNAMRLLKLVNTLLDFSRIESGRVNARFVPVNLDSFTKDLASGFRSVIESAGLQYNTVFGNLNSPAYVDREMWEKIVLNLLSNAFKYTPAGSITISLQADGKNIVLKVSDTGTGIPESELPRLFERFHRVPNSGGRSYEGTGIGLSLVKELVTLHGGNITADSKPGRGTTFTVTIPMGNKHLPPEMVFENESSAHSSMLQDMYALEAISLTGENAQKSTSADSADTAEKITPEHRENSARVLVVDDNADMRKYIYGLLQGEFTVYTAGNGREALEVIEKDGAPDIILSDIMMPGMDGIQLLNEVKKNPETARVPVILLSARAGEEAKIEGYDTGADDYLVKPFSAKELVARVKSHVKLNRIRTNTEMQLWNVFSQAPVAICILKGADFKIELANEKMLEIWGRKLDDVLNKPVFAAFPEALTQGFKELLTQVYTTGQPFSATEMQLELLRNGERHVQYGNFIYRPVTDENGTIEGIACVAVDVTESVVTRKKIEQDEKRLQQLLMGLPVAVYTTDINGQILSYNDEAVKLWGKTPAAGENVWCGSQKVTRLDGSSINVEEYPIVKAIKRQKLIRDEVYLYRPNGDARHVLVHPQPIFSITGEITGAVNALVDITEIKETEKALKTSEMRYRQLVQALPVALYTTDADGRVEMYNKAATSLWGREPLTGEKAWELWKGYDLDGNVLQDEDKPIYQLLKQNKLMRGKEILMERADGKQFNVLPYPEPIYNAAGQLVEAISMMVDVTALKQAEQALQESRERFRIVADTAPVMIWMTDNKGSCTFINHHWTEFSGTSIPESLGSGWMKHLHPDDFQSTEQAFWEAFNNRKEYSIEFRLRRNDGEYRWISDHGRPRYAATGDFKGFVGTCVDITDRKMIREELEKQVAQRTRELNHQKDFLQTILDSSVDIIAVFDSEGRYLAVNKKCEDVYRKTREEMVGHKMEDVFPATRGNEFHKLLFKTFKDKKINTLAHQSNIISRYYETFFVPVYDDDKVTSVMAIAHDQTDLVMANEKLKKTNEELLRTNQELEQFAYVASHDLQEPLRKIRIFSELLRENMASAEVAEKYLDKIAASASRMTTLIKDVLDYSRLSKTGEMFVEADLNKILENVKTDFDLLIEQKNACINYSGLPVVKGIPLQLHQLFTNLVSNSLKFADKPPVIEIDYKLVKGRDVNHEALHPEKNYAEILFKDNGIGFDQQYADQIFVIFHRLNDRSSYSGTGIGLALCKKIIENHNGHIVALGKPGEGAAFRMYLPVYQTTE